MIAWMFYHLLQCNPFLHFCQMVTLTHEIDRFVSTSRNSAEMLLVLVPKECDECNREKESHCYRPVDSEKERRSAQHDNRKTPLSCGNRPGTNRKRKPKRTAGKQYTTDSYRRAIHRACDLAFPAPEPLCRRDDESVRKWQERLTDKQRAELD